MNARISSIITAISLAPIVMATGESSLFYKEANLTVGYSDNEGWIGEKNPVLKNSIGFEWLKVFSNDFGDYLTTDLQMRLSYDTSGNFDDDWAIEIHNAWMDYKLGMGKYLRFGHFAPSYGLEYDLDTHSTLFQTLAGHDIGFKKDWGIGYRSGVSIFDYSLAAQVGSGMALEQKDDSYLISARIGNPANGNFQYGISMLSGNVLSSDRMQTFPKPEISEHAISKQRIGADAQYLAGSFMFLGEVTVGQNESEDVAGTLVEVDYIIPDFQEVTLKAQSQFWSDDFGNSSENFIALGLGVTWQFNKSWTARSGVFAALERPDDNNDTQIFLQFYYLGK